MCHVLCHKVCAVVVQCRFQGGTHLTIFCSLLDYCVGLSCVQGQYVEGGRKLEVGPID